MLSFCICIVDVPYSKSYVFDITGPGSLPSFLAKTKGIDELCAKGLEI